jgi:hypothetical protein
MLDNGARERTTALGWKSVYVGDCSVVRIDNAAVACEVLFAMSNTT